MENRWVDKIYTFQVDAEGQPVNKKFDLDKNVKVVHGIMMSSDKPNLLFYRGSQRIELSGEELFPEDFESKMFMSGMAVAPDDKYNRWVAESSRETVNSKSNTRTRPIPTLPLLTTKLSSTSYVR